MQQNVLHQSRSIKHDVVMIALDRVIDRIFTTIIMYSLVGNTLTFNVAEDPGFESHFERLCYRNTCACVPTNIRTRYLSGSSGIQMKRVGQRMAVYGTIVP